VVAKFIEGDYLETVEGLFFAVKGFRHPRGRVMAYLRYIPDPTGERLHRGKRYRRVYDIEDTTELLKAKYPYYFSEVDYLGQSLQTVPVERIKKVYDPGTALKMIIENPRNHLEEAAKEFVSALIHESRVPLRYLGISGSLMTGFATKDSDIDLIVYGAREGRNLYEALSALRNKTEGFRAYNREEVEKVARSRWGDTGIDPRKFLDTEIKKVLHGFFFQTEYFVRLIGEPRDTESSSKPVHKTTCRGIISEDKDSIFTPCRYGLRELTVIDPKGSLDLSELLSYRGKFTEQAKKDDFVEFRGTLEEYILNDEKRYRVVLGTSGDYLVPAETFDR
jgi:predicted nucleotidyltransferase